MHYMSTTGINLNANNNPTWSLPSILKMNLPTHLPLRYQDISAYLFKHFNCLEHRTIVNSFSSSQTC